MFCFSVKYKPFFVVHCSFIHKRKKKKLDIAQETREINYYSAAKRKQLLINATM